MCERTETKLFSAPQRENNNWLPQLKPKIGRKGSTLSRLPVESLGEHDRGSNVASKIDVERRKPERSSVPPRELDAEEAVQPQAKPSSLDGSVRTEHAGQGAQRQIRRKIFDPGVQKAWLRDDQGQEIYLGLQVVLIWSCQENEDRGSSSDFEYGRMERYLFESRVDSHIEANTRWRNLSLERRQKRQKFSAPGTFRVNATADPNQIGLWVNMVRGREVE
ncbi:hypothetical protein C8R45DRAFT_942562 [Mycena sanguinolenta]|nr:hypothetical protein C8R45DRAFT_942562 [Mycena sanguinolenta]